MKSNNQVSQKPCNKYSRYKVPNTPNTPTVKPDSRFRNDPFDSYSYSHTQNLPPSNKSPRLRLQNANKILQIPSPLRCRLAKSSRITQHPSPKNLLKP